MKLAKLSIAKMFETLVLIVKLYANIAITNDKNSENLIKKSCDNEYLKLCEQYFNFNLCTFDNRIIGYRITINDTINIAIAYILV